jgi:SAM-dependent methyltransferase
VNPTEALKLGVKDHLTHRGNARSTRYGWMRLTPMFSVRLVREIIENRGRTGLRVFDPFCGTATTALVAAELGYEATTSDINPFLLWLSAAKTRRYTTEELFGARLHVRVVSAAMLDEEAGMDWVPPISNIDRWWAPPILEALSRAWRAIREAEMDPPSRDLLTVAFLRVVIEGGKISFGHQSMSFRDETAADADIGRLVASWQKAISDVLVGAASTMLADASVVHSDARDLEGLATDSADLVITSPPYCNRMSYIRELRPQMFWLGLLDEARQAGELDWLAIGGTWGVATSRVGKWEPAQNSLEVPYEGFASIVEEVGQRSDVLARYIHRFFVDMTHHVQALSRVVTPEGEVHYIVGNSKFFETMVPMEHILASTFEAYGFRNPTVRTLRKRSSKRELFEFHVSASAA